MPVSNVASDWPRTFLHPRCFCLAYLLLVTIDAYSKWPEVHIIPSTSAQTTIDKLRIIFAIHGIPMTLVSDNGTPFQSKEFHKFMNANGIIDHHVPPYHPSSNGLAENMVKTVKQALSKCDHQGRHY